MALKSKQIPDKLREIWKRWKGIGRKYDLIVRENGIRIFDHDTGEKLAWINGGKNSEELAYRVMEARTDILALASCINPLLGKIRQLETEVNKKNKDLKNLEKYKLLYAKERGDRAFFESNSKRLEKSKETLDKKLKNKTSECSILRAENRSISSLLVKSESKSRRWKEKYESEKSKPRFVAECNLPGGKGLSGRKGEDWHHRSASKSTAAGKGS